MAVWQYDVVLVPRAGIIRQHGNVPEELPGYRAVWDPEKGTNEAYPNYWERGDSPERLAGEISLTLPPCPAWSDKALMFGDEEGNIVKIWLGESLDFRFDLRKPDLELLRAMIALASSHDLLWVSDTLGHPITPSFNNVLEDIQASDAYRFCKDPIGFLRALPKEAKVSEPGAAPNGGPTTQLGDSGNTGGPSVS